MNYKEMSDAFDVYSNRYSDAKLGSLLYFDEYEKSLFITKAANIIVKEMLPFYDKNEKIREQLLDITRTKQLTADSGFVNTLKFDKSSFVYKLPSDIMYIVAESIRSTDGTLVKKVRPLHDDEFYYTLDNPFRVNTDEFGYRSFVSLYNSTDNVIDRYAEIYTTASGKYFIKYLCNIPPFVLDSNLDDGSIGGINANAYVDHEAPLSMLHEKIIDKAVELGYMAKNDDINSKVATSKSSAES